MPAPAPQLSDIWPYDEAAAPPELATLPVDVFFTDPKASSITAASWVRGKDPETAPRAAYALRITRSGGQGELARWNADRSRWEVTAEFPMAGTGAECTIVELDGIILSNVRDVDALKERLTHLLRPELAEAKAYRLTSKAMGVLSVMTLFLAVRQGVEEQAPEPFALIFAIATGIGMLAALMRNRTRVLGEIGLARMREQFRFEYRPAEHEGLSLGDVTTILQGLERRREEEAVVFAFLLLLCFVYFISPLVVIGVIVALILVTLLMGDPMALRRLILAQDKGEQRLQHAVLSLRAGDDVLSPPALRSAKRQVLRDRLRRFGDLADTMREGKRRQRLSQDLALAMAFLVIFTAYAVPIAAGFQKLSISVDDSLVSTSLFSVAPVIVLLSISKTTVALAQIANRHVMARKR